MSVRPPNTYSGSALRKLRLERGMTATELARRTGLGRTTIWTLESERSPVSRPTRQLIAAALLDIPVPVISKEEP